MEHYYNTIENSEIFNYPSFYEYVVKRFDSGSRFVEIGSWLGCSASCMGVEIANSKKDIEFYCIDLWSGVMGSAAAPSDEFYNKFLSNIEPVKQYIKPIKSNSAEGAKHFEDSYFDFIFIDAAHDYQSVKADLNAWWPKIKKDGIFAGHDYQPMTCHQGVVDAVDEFCREKNLSIELNGTCWVIDLKK